MIKMSMFNKINDVLIVDAFKNVIQRRSSKLLLLRQFKISASLSIERQKTCRHAYWLVIFKK